MTPPTTETRLKNLNAIIRIQFNGNRAEFARAIGRSPGLAHQWVHEYRTIGEKSARLIERCLALPTGALDAPDADKSINPKTNLEALTAKVQSNLKELEHLLPESDLQSHERLLVARTAIAEIQLKLHRENSQPYSPLNKGGRCPTGHE